MKRAIAMLMLLGVLLLGGYQIAFGVEPYPPCSQVCAPPWCSNWALCNCPPGVDTYCRLCLCDL